MFPSPPVLRADRYRQVREAGDWPVGADERSWQPRWLPMEMVKRGQGWHRHPLSDSARVRGGLLIPGYPWVGPPLHQVLAVNGYWQGQALRSCQSREG